MNTETDTATNERYRFNPVKDSRGREIDGLSERNGRYYVQVWIPGKGPRRFCLTDDQHQPIRDSRQAADAAVTFRNNKRNGEMPESGKAPKFKDYYTVYLDWLTTTEAKKKETISKERGDLKSWLPVIGDVRITHITPQHISEYVLARKKDGVSNRTVNLGVLALSNMLWHAKSVDGWIKGKPATDDWQELGEKVTKHRLYTREDMEKIFAECLRTRDCEREEHNFVQTYEGPKGKWRSSFAQNRARTDAGVFLPMHNREKIQVPVHPTGELIADWLKFMAYSGARRAGALAMKWENVDWNNRLVYIVSKYDKTSIVNFNPLLEAHLKDMHSRRVPGSPWLFPSSRSDSKAGHARRLDNTLEKIREAAGFPDFTPHDCRHHFISYAVMEGIDYMTIAGWVGHADGGVLIGKVYGHLAPGHAKKKGEAFTFGEKVEKPAPAANVDVSALSATDLLALVQKKLAAGEKTPATTPV